MLINRETLPRHRFWIIFAALTTVIATLWFFMEWMSGTGRPSGGSVPGLVFGIACGIIITFEFLLWPRKMVRTWRIGRTEAWLRAHVWLGLLSMPLALYHSGFRMGGTLSSVLMILFLLVIASGVAGLLLQQWLPSRMLYEIGAETIHSQIHEVLSQLRDEADRLVAATCGMHATLGAHESAEQTNESNAGGAVVVGAIERVGGLHGRVLQTVTSVSPLVEGTVVQEFYKRLVRPFLLDRPDPRSPLHSAQQAANLFQDLRNKLEPNAWRVVEVLESLCSQRRQLDKQSRLHFWLHSWLWVHLPLSAALMFFMVVHVWGAIQYW